MAIMGQSLSHFDVEVNAGITKLVNVIDSDAAKAIWAKAMDSKYIGSPVWIHGDMSSGNLLIKDGQLCAVIDFGTMAVGDPACDLVMAWIFFGGKSREHFKSKLKRDSATWARARGWALLKVLFTLAFNDGRTNEQTIHSHELFAQILLD